MRSSASSGSSPTGNSASTRITFDYSPSRRSEIPAVTGGGSCFTADCTKVSDISSAGSHRLTSGQDVLGGIDVPVVPGAAGRALPCPRGQVQFCEQVPARRACLGGRVETVDHDKLPPVPLAFVFELPAELAPATVANRTRQVPVAHHVRHGQVLDHDHIVLTDQARTQPVQEIGARGASLAMRAGDLRFGL